MPTLAGLFTGRNRQKLARELENARLFGDQPFSWDWEERRDLYGRWQAMYDNTAYEVQRDGGFREIILKDLGIDCEEPALSSIGPYFNPIKPIVDAYQNVLLGTFGKEIKVAPQFNGVDVTPVLSADADNPLGRIWRWSNLDTEKQMLQRNAAGLGACGIRIVADAGEDALSSRVTLQCDHPGRIKDFDTNARGDCTAVMLEYTVLAGPLGGDRREVKVEEVITKEGFEVKQNGKTVRQGDNPFGFCPYVILRHADRGEWGLPAFFGSETPIHKINVIRAAIQLGVWDVINAQWFGTAGGRKPSDPITFGRNRLIYVQTEQGAPPPSLEPLVAPLNIADASNEADKLEDRVRQRNPEFILSDMKLLSGLSGETLAKANLAVAEKIGQARPVYEHAIIRALQMALSEMIVMGMLEVGTGSGSATAADRAYQEGKLNFEFESRPALPMTPFDAQNQAKADTARQAADLANAKLADGLVDQLELLRIAGYSEKDTEEIIRRKREQDAIPTEGL